MRAMAEAVLQDKAKLVCAAHLACAGNEPRAAGARRRHAAAGRAARGVVEAVGDGPMDLGGLQLSDPPLGIIGMMRIRCKLPAKTLFHPPRER